MERILSQSVKTLRLYIMTQNCVPIRVTRLKNCVYIVVPTHVETVVKLAHKKDTPKIEVTMGTGAENNYTPAEKATYGKIKEYVKESMIKTYPAFILHR